jgi:hypothetical protein
VRAYNPSGDPANANASLQQFIAFQNHAKKMLQNNQEKHGMFAKDVPVHPSFDSSQRWPPETSSNQDEIQRN